MYSISILDLRFSEAPIGILDTNYIALALK